MPDEDYFRIRQAVLKSLFQIDVATEKELDTVLGEFNNAQYTLFNGAMLPVMGIGDDCFCLCEHLDNKTLLDFDTLYHYDYADHEFQEQAWKAESPDYVSKPYRGRLHYVWARLKIDGDFYYANLCLAAGYTISKIEEAGDSHIAHLVPREYVAGKNHGKREGRGSIYDKRVAAGGLEAQLEELRYRFYKYLSERRDELQDAFNQEASRTVYMFDRSTQDERHMDFVFTDKAALQSIRFRHFMKDCRDLTNDDPQALSEIIDHEEQAMLHFLNDNHRDVLENFDPRIVKFRKRRKIVIADGALDGLL
jgi:hypothetical protein